MLFTKRNENRAGPQVNCFFAPCNGIQDTLGFWIPPRGFRIPITGFQIYFSGVGFRIRIVSGIPDSYTCIPDSKSKNFQDSGFQMQKFLGFRNPDSFTWGEFLVSLLRVRGTGILLYRWILIDIFCLISIGSSWSSDEANNMKFLNIERP